MIQSGEPQIERQARDLLIGLPLPPSTNDRMIPIFRNGRPRMVLSNKAHQYLDGCGIQLKVWTLRNNWLPINRYWPVEFYYRLANANSDSHNLIKIACDVLQQGRIFQNDKFILAREMTVEINPNNPGVVLKVPGLA